MGFLHTINEMLTSRFGELGPLYALGFVGVIFIIATLPIFLKKSVDPLDRLKSLQEYHAAIQDQ